ncbi:MAG: polyamine ABC transporter substrate-binding protein [Chloroflexi bacterium]|nr:MAG: polyamine ABC transporter substrate-binding protein [Chloroflexota bacterium]
MKRWLLLAVLVSLLAAVGACAGATPETVTVVETVVVTKEVQGETVTVVETVEVVKEVEKEVVVTATPVPMEEPVILRLGQNAADLGSLDPHFATSTQDRSVVDMIFNGLLRYKPGDGAFDKMEPDLAEDFPEMEMVDGKQVWTFKLRQGVKCHPAGKLEAYELTAEDVVYSLEKAANPDRSAYAGEYTGMTFEAVDDYTVKITLEQPLSPVLFYPKVANYSGGFIVCKKAVEALGDDKFKTHPVGTGPFMFESYSPQEKVVLKANPDYFRGKPKLDGVEMRYIPDISSREAGLLAGELDVINGIPDIAWVDRMKNEGNVTVDVFGVGEVATVHFNTSKPPLDNPEVRKALAYALDRDEFLALFGEPIAENVYSPVPAKFLAGGLTKEEVEELGLAYDVDREKAKQMLADAGYPDGFDLEVITSEMTGYRRIYESMQAQLAEIGVNMKVNVVDHSTMHSQIRKDVNPIVVYIAWRPNADVYLTRFFHSDSIVVTGAKPDTNFSHYDKIDDLIEQARGETDAEKQVELWKEAQIKILEDMVAYPLQFQQQVYARANYVDYGHDLVSVFALYPGITEQTTLNK